MRPFRSRVLAALVMAILSLGVLGSVAFADDTPTTTGCFPEDPWGIPNTGFPEDPWPSV
jgi:hypothetical protein